MRKPPTYRARSGYSRALVTLTDARTRRRRDCWLGDYGAPARRERYHRLIAEWDSRGRRLPNETASPGAAAPADDFTIMHLIHEHWEWARGYYASADQVSIRMLVRPLRTY